MLSLITILANYLIGGMARRIAPHVDCLGLGLDLGVRVSGGVWIGLRLDYPNP